MPERERLLSAIAREQSLLASLEKDEARARVRLETLRADFGALDAAPSGTPPRAGEPRAPATASDKVALFRSLFRGRTDVFPRRWQNRRTGKAGYAPACANEWVRGVCDKPRVRCSECPNQAFVPVTDQEILGHLQGRHVIGVYPLLEDETCWLLAVDFDKASWVDDASAFLQTCRSFELPASIERSRSGNGAHVWFFFSAPVAAATARRMGCALLTETMARRHELRMESYDRLFPSQDTSPAGGFGNLIALPLQLEARQKENTVFLDDDFIPHPDQWAYLAGLPQIEPAKVAHIGEQAAREGRIIGLRLPSGEDGWERAPWLRSPSRATRRPVICEPLPCQVLLGVESDRQLLAQPWVGASFECHAIEQILGHAEALGHRTVPFFLRTHDGHEIDLVLEVGGSRWAVEVKLSTQPDRRDLQRLTVLADAIGANRRILLSRSSDVVESRSGVVCNFPWLIQNMKRLVAA